MISPYEAERTKASFHSTFFLLGRGCALDFSLVFRRSKKKNLKFQLTLCAKRSYHVKEYKISEDYSCSVHVANLFTHGLLQWTEITMIGQRGPRVQCRVAAA